MAQIVASVPAGAIGTNVAPWRNRIMTTNDGYRCIVYSDGTNLQVATSPSGATWTVQGAVVAATAYTPLIDACFANGYLYVVVTNASTNVATLYYWKYGSAGTFSGTVSSLALNGSAFTVAALSTRMVYDPTAVNADPNHLSGASGLIYVLVDFGASWTFFALDPHYGASPGAMQVIAQDNLTVSVTGPTGATNMILQSKEHLYVITAGSSAWSAYPITYTSTYTSTTTSTDETINQTSSAVGTSGGTTTSTGNFPNPVGPAPAGTWSATFNATATNPTHEPASLVMSFAGNNITITGSSGTFTIGATGSAASASFYATYTSSTDVPNQGGTLTVTGPSNIVTTTTNTLTNQFSLGALEAPTLAYSSYGAAICRADTTSNPALDVFATHTISGVVKVNTCQRSNTGGYSTALDISCSGTFIDQGVGASQNTSTGDEAVFVAGSSSAVNHVYEIPKTAGVWASSPTQVDAGNTTSVTLPFGCIGSRILGSFGPGCIYTIGAPLNYGDANYVLDSTSTPSDPTPSLIILNDATPGVNTAPATSPTLVITGSSSPYIAIAQGGYMQFTYKNPNTTDPMSAYQVTGTYTPKGGTATNFTCAKIPVVNGPTNGQTFTCPFPPDFGVASGNWYADGAVISNIGVTVWDSVANVSSATPTAGEEITINCRTAPVVSISSPSPITSINPQFGVLVAQPDGYAINAYEFSIDSIDTGQVGLTTTVLSTTVNAAQASGVGTSATPLVTNGPLNVGQQISLDGVVYTVSTSTLSGSLYDIVLTSATTTAIAAGDTVYGYIPVPQQTIVPPLINGNTYTLMAKAWTNSGSGTSWVGQTSESVVVQVPLPPPATSMTALSIPGDNPLQGGYIQLSFNEPGPGSSQSVPSTYALSMKKSGDATFSPLGTFSLTQGLNRKNIYNVGNGISYDFQVQVYDVNGVAAPSSTIIANVVAKFRQGLWLNDPNNPSVCLNLGVFGTYATATSTGYPMEYEAVQDKETVNLFNRPAPIIQVGSTYARHTTTNPTFVYEEGYEEACNTLIRKWDASGENLLIRDVWGNVFIGSILSAIESADNMAAYRSVTIEFQETDTANYLGVTS